MMHFSMHAIKETLAHIEARDMLFVFKRIYELLHLHHCTLSSHIVDRSVNQHRLTDLGATV